MDPISIALYDDISGPVAKEVLTALMMNPGADVTLRINSPGGEVTSGYAIANALKSHAGRKIAVIEGLCASAATFPACACDEIHMYPESLFMVHGPWGEVSGGPEAMNTQGDLLGKMTDLCAAMYQRKSGAPETQVREWMARDTWMKPDEAMAAGFCDKILTDAAPPKARAAAQRYMARLRPPTNKGAPNMAMKDGMFPENLAAKLAKYGLGDDMSPEMLRAACLQYLAKTEEGPMEREEMMKAMALIEKVEGDTDQGERSDNPVTTMKAKEGDDEASSSDKGMKMAAKLAKDAHLNPAVQKLVDALTKDQTKMAKQVATLEAAAKAREIADYHAFAKGRVSKEDADEYLVLSEGNLTLAKTLVSKHPVKSATQRVTMGGKPIGAADVTATAAEAAPMSGRHQLHGYALSKLARAQFKDKAPSFDELRAAQKNIAKTRPDLFA